MTLWQYLVHKTNEVCFTEQRWRLRSANLQSQPSRYKLHTRPQMLKDYDTKWRNEFFSEYESYFLKKYMRWN